LRSDRTLLRLLVPNGRPLTLVRVEAHLSPGSIVALTWRRRGSVDERWSGWWTLAWT
jgi:hypothetical protein